MKVQVDTRALIMDCRKAEPMETLLKRHSKEIPPHDDPTPSLAFRDCSSRFEVHVTKDLGIHSERY